MLIKDKYKEIEDMITEAGYVPTEKLVKSIYQLNQNMKEIHSIKELKDLYNRVNMVAEAFKHQELLEIAAGKLSMKILREKGLEK